jgi:hypothetical protein
LKKQLSGNALTLGGILHREIVDKEIGNRWRFSSDCPQAGNAILCKGMRETISKYVLAFTNANKAGSRRNLLFRTEHLLSFQNGGKVRLALDSEYFRPIGFSDISYAHFSFLRTSSTA